MRKLLLAGTVGLMLLAVPAIQAAAKAHVVIFGKTMVVKLFTGDDESKFTELRVRPLLVDGKLKEYTVGEAHQITERQFAVQRAFRVNDSLPEERGATRWRWQRGGWLLVDRVAGRVSPLRLPDFDPLHSEAAWYRDYAAYCGVSDTGDKLYAVVAQVGVRKPALRQLLRPTTGGTEPECGRPVWQRGPTRVMFDVKPDQKLTFAVHGRAVNLEPAGEDESEQ